MERYLNKKYRLVESENYDEYLKRTKVRLFFRKLEQIVRQTIKLYEKDGKYVFETYWPMVSVSAVFRPGISFDEQRIDGVHVKSIIEFKDNKMIHTQKVNDEETKFVREYSDKQIKTTITCGNVICHRMYARVYER
ncbi:fatty acid-binding protein, putative [Pediculus humanus corporis]|uniref:Fatty acid-binding protein, putative n=1 Tax=Pediculus humanus subsp. corporis TaxID=121224 RepID=E0W294_PEDHC|nr:fatty acid-binding protein, putative [Pediculus humanus corporis]EEB19749.1 fatty acid-binding protein, putative [Pediculus humanus corporis]